MGFFFSCFFFFFFLSNNAATACILSTLQHSNYPSSTRRAPALLMTGGNCWEGRQGLEGDCGQCAGDAAASPPGQAWHPWVGGCEWITTLETEGSCPGSASTCLEVLVAHRGVMSFSRHVADEAVMVTAGSRASSAGLWVSRTSHQSYTSKKRLLKAEERDVRDQEDWAELWTMIVSCACSPVAMRCPFPRSTWTSCHPWTTCHAKVFVLWRSGWKSQEPLVGNCLTRLPGEK